MLCPILVIFASLIFHHRCTKRAKIPKVAGQMSELYFWNDLHGSGCRSSERQSMVSWAYHLPKRFRPVPVHLQIRAFEVIFKRDQEGEYRTSYDGRST